jgi:hypothetical protein
VVDVEHAQEVRPVEQRRGAQRVEALLDDRGPDGLGALVVPIADREQWPAGRDRSTREALVGDLADPVELDR